MVQGMVAQCGDRLELIMFGLKCNPCEGRGYVQHPKVECMACAGCGTTVKTIWRMGQGLEDGPEGIQTKNPGDTKVITLEER